MCYCIILLNHICLQVFGFKVAIQGNILWVIVILLALGGVGMSLGLVISGAATIGISFVANPVCLINAIAETEAVQLSLSAYFPALLMSGVIWPLEAVSNVLVCFGLLSFNWDKDTWLDVLVVYRSTHYLGCTSFALYHDTRMGYTIPASLACDPHHRWLGGVTDIHRLPHIKEKWYCTVVQKEKAVNIE